MALEQVVVTAMGIKKKEASLTANVKVNSWFTLQVRGNVDFVSDKFENKMYASTSPNIAGTYDGLMSGRYVWLIRIVCWDGAIPSLTKVLLCISLSMHVSAVM